MALRVLVLLFVVGGSVEAVAQVGDGRIYVNRISFAGADFVDDEVLRQELLQLEGTHIDTVALERSRQRLERLPYINTVQIRQQPVAGVPDQVDLIITVTELPAREYRLGGAYSEALGLSGFGYFVNQNVLGTGQQLLARLDGSEYQTQARLFHTDPWAHADGVSRTIGLTYQQFDQLTADTTELDGDFLSATLDYRYRIGERQSINLGLGIEDAAWRVGSQSSLQLANWVANNGDSQPLSNGTRTDAVIAEFRLGWHHNTLDQRIFPSLGLEQRFDLDVAIPGSDVEYVTADYAFDKYWSSPRGWVTHLKTRLAYGTAYGSDTTALAPNRNWFAGGPDSVRGYRDGGLGPRDSLGNPYGGNLLVANQLEVFAPLPEKWQDRLRLGVFYDIGNVFSTEDIVFSDSSGDPIDYGFDVSELRQSAGIAAEIKLPVGLLKLSYGIPLNANDRTANPFLRDEIDRFQIAFGVQF
ncbi:MAG: FtsQ-type POTRA domain-containing protein [Pseudomonadota bacterium]